MSSDNIRSMFVEKAFSSLCEIIAKEHAEELEVKGALLCAKEALIKQKKEETSNALNSAFIKSEEQLKRAGAILKEALKVLPPVEREKIEKEMGHSVDVMLSFLAFSKEKETLFMKENDTFQSVLGLSNETLLWIYSVGHGLSLEDKNEEALSVFQTLTLLNPLIDDYYIAQGLVERALQSNEPALYSFAMCTLINPNHLVARYNSTEIYLDLNEVNEAVLEFEILEKLVNAQNLVDLKPEVDSLRSRILLAKEGV